MHFNKVTPIEWLQGNAFIIVMLFAFGLFSPELSPKVSLLDNDLGGMLDVRSGSDRLKQVFWLGFTLIFLFLFLRNRNNLYYQAMLSRLSTPILYFVSIFALAILTCIWSDFWVITIKRSMFQLILYCVVIQSVVFCYINSNLLRSFEVLICFVSILIVLSILLGVGINPYGELAGYSKTKNVMGAILCVLFVCSHMVFRFYGMTSKHKILLFMLVFFLLITYSKTSIALVMIYYAFTKLPSSVSKFTVMMIIFLSISVFIILPLLSFLIGDYTTISEYVDGGFITGRGYIWDAIYYEMYYFDKLMMGYGFGSFFGTPIIPYFFDDEYSFLRYISSSHNGYIELLTQFGFFSLFILSYFLLFINVRNKLVCAALIVPALYNITEPAIMRDQHVVWIMSIFLLSFVYLTKEEFNNDSN